MKKPQWISRWFKTVLKNSRYQISTIPLSLSKEWILENGRIHHKNESFFSVVGTEWITQDSKVIRQMLIDQNEIGTLGFLLRHKKNMNELLVQAKIEPGNMGVVQLSPTYQATASNELQRHGGKKPPYFEFFHTSNTPIYQSLQSEQGSRFLNKQNRNVLITEQSTPPRLTQNHKWIRVDSFLNLLHHDFLINTDARSVLVCSPWNRLINRTPFARYKTSFAKDLARSFCQPIDTVIVNQLLKQIDTIRQISHFPQIIPLHSVSNKNFSVKHIKVVAHGREVSQWDQPIIDSKNEGNIDLVCGRKKGVLHFLFQIQAEVGLYNRVELSSSFIKEPGGSIGKIPSYPRSQIIVESRQSEEGGRFYQDVNLYRIVDIGNICKKSGKFVWLTLSQIEFLLQKDGIFTNEARSAIALLLWWL